jgi:hypothetical protein
VEDVDGEAVKCGSNSPPVLTGIYDSTCETKAWGTPVIVDRVHATIIASERHVW